MTSMRRAHDALRRQLLPLAVDEPRIVEMLTFLDELDRQEAV